MKPLLTTKTFWWHALWTAVALAGLSGYSEFVPPPEYSTLINAIGGMIVRLWTSEPASLTGS